jgi:phage gpG-like protein
MIKIEIKRPNLNGLKAKYKQTVTRLPRLLGATAVEYVHGNFRAQGFVDKGTDKWKPRKRTDTGRAILVKSGALRRDIRVRGTGPNYVIVGTSLPYASIHNEGGTIAHPGGTAFFKKDGKLVFVKNSTARGRKFPRTRPHKIGIIRRQFMPTNARPSAKLNRMIKDVIITELNKIN